ncbi:hypothetical protein SLEP1_g42227 [Rubroshorea leprosula]|uniref:Reverse transcriptase domain-containing protein n=1 Tax=Rubroshorea leprosula TaxID=152421 RepID=A0AAV5L9D6_9ROSI|nr:hypothetical protein SLEP1_g42227 [Rubroshorea leprosula]
MGVAPKAIHDVDGSEMHSEEAAVERCVNQYSPQKPPTALMEGDLSHRGIITRPAGRSGSLSPSIVTPMQHTSPLNAMETSEQAFLSAQPLDTSSTLNQLPRLQLPTATIQTELEMPCMDFEMGLLLSEQIETHLSLGRPTNRGTKRKTEFGPFEQIFKRACIRDTEASGLQCSPNQLQQALAQDRSDFHVQDQLDFFTDVDETITVRKVRRRIQQKALARQVRFQPDARYLIFQDFHPTQLSFNDPSFILVAPLVNTFPDPQGYSGGLALWWTDEVHISIFSSDKNMVDGNCSDANYNVTWHFSFIYGEPNTQLRRTIWSRVMNVRHPLEIPWLVMGDLNLVGDNYDKKGKHPPLVTDRRLLEELTSSAIPVLPKRQFRYELTWQQHKDYEGVVSHGWATDQSGPPLYCMASKISHCKKHLLNWCKHTIGNPRHAMGRLQKELDELQLEEQSETNLTRQRLLVDEINVLWSQEEAYWFQRAHTNWMLLGDGNSKYFHATASRRRQNNYIFQLKNDQGILLEGTDSILAHAYTHFQQAYASQENCNFTQIEGLIRPLVTAEMNVDLCRHVSDEEVKTTVFQMGAFKAPGVDGFPGCFFQKHWDIVGSDVCKAVQHFFTNGFMLRKMKKTKLILILKVKNPELISQYRPISLCNFTYKVIAKILANCLKVYLDDLISPFQSTFVSGRTIQDNILIAHEAFHGLHLKKSGKHGVIALKLDIQKAYDNVDWHCLENIMRAHGFCEKWIHMVMQCVSTVSYTVATSAKKISGYKIRRRSPTISHLLFVDDSLIFCRATMEEVNQLQTILQVYGDVSGQRVNFSKSVAIFSSNTPYEVSAKILIRSSGNFGGVNKMMEGNYAGKGSHPSWAWSSILKGRDIVQIGMRWNVGNGQNILIYQDNWVPTLPSFKVNSPSETHYVFSYVCELLDDKGGWDIAKLNASFSNQVSREILKIPTGACVDSLVWHHDKYALGLNPRQLRVSCFSEWWKYITGTAKQMGILSLVEQCAIICWHIWKARNEQFFEHVVLNPHQILACISAMTQECSSLLHTQLLVSPSRSQEQGKQQQPSWVKPSMGFLKVNVDASYSSQTGFAAFSMVARNFKGEICFDNSWLSVALSPLMVEATALYKAV